MAATELRGTDRLTDLGIVLATAASLFTARIVCEQTLVAWTVGMQMTGLPVPQLVLDSARAAVCGSRARVGHRHRRPGRAAPRADLCDR